MKIATKLSFEHLKQLISLEREHLIILFIYGFVVGVLNLTVPIAVQALVSNISFGLFLQPIVVLSLILLAGLIFAAVLRVLQIVVVEMIQRRLLIRFIDDLSNRLPNLREDAFDGKNGRETMNRIFDVFLAQKAISTLLVSGLEIVLVVGLGVLVLVAYHPYLALFDLGLIIIPLFVFFLLGRNGIKTAIAESKVKYKMAWYVQELGSLSIPQLASNGGQVKEKLDDLSAEYIDRRREHFRIVFRQVLFGFVLFAFANAALLGIGGWLVVQGSLTLGQLVAAELIVTAVVASMSKLGKLFETYYDLMASLDKIGQVVNLPMKEEQSKLPEEVVFVEEEE